MKKLGSGPTAHLGVLYKGGRGWRIQPVSKKARHDYKPSKIPEARKIKTSSGSAPHGAIKATCALRISPKSLAQPKAGNLRA